MFITDDENEKKEKTSFTKDFTIHLERDVGSASISPSGRDVVLASLDGLDIIDLDNPYTRPRHLRHTTSWSVPDVQWSPFAARDYWVVSTSNQKALVWNLTMSENSYQGAVEHTLHAHTRAITDINFSAHHPDILSTCAVDGYVNCWDLRRPRRPCMTFVDWFAGATQVKWNRQDEHILASSHDRWLRIWDDRKGAAPLRSIEAHDSKVYGIDWNRTRANGVVTCSLDRSIKFWDIENPEDIPERVIKTDFPVWRARHTPFGWGLLAMPQDKPGDLHLYDRRHQFPSDTKSSAAATFPGHGQNKVKEFLWRVRGSITDTGVDDRDFQLVSWGEDCELRLQHIDPEVLKSVGYEKGTQVRKKLNITRKGAVYKTFRDIESATEKQSAAITGPRPNTVLNLQSSVSSTTAKKMLPPKAFQGHMMPVIKDKNKRSTSGNQIVWISGVKFNRKVENPERDTTTGRRLSIMSPSYNLNDWDSPETLHEEIMRVHQVLTKVKFDNLNLDNRNITVSMNGPWGSGGNSVFIKVNIYFPDQYPESEPPTFMLGKTSNISEELLEKMANELHQLAEGFVTRKHGCLEAALCYLLGEVNLEESATAWFSEAQSLDDNSDALADESSSDDEDGGIPPGASAMMSQELDANGVSEIAQNGNANVPLPRLCGAVFSKTGKLVCFFPPKEDKVKSLLGNLSAGMRKSRAEKKFETFSRLKNESPGARNNMSSNPDESRYDSDSSEASYTSSSDSDSSPFPNFPVQYWQPRTRGRRYLKALSTNQSIRSSAGGTGTNTGTGTGTAFSKGRLKPKNTISIYDLEAFCPAKKVLAQEYVIFGDGPDVCEKNAQIAAKHGYQELADVWQYAKLILLDDIPLEVLTRGNIDDPILIVARDAIRRSRRSSRDSGVDISESTPNFSGLSGRVKWGHNPLAKTLIDALFHHFEHPADIQMLAMLSCVFSEPAAQDSVSQFEMHLSQPITPMSMKTPAFSLDYFPSDSAAWNMTRLIQSSQNISPKPAPTIQGIFGSMGSNGIWGSDPNSGTYSTGDTPPRQLSDIGPLITHSLSTSPETSRVFRRANSTGLTSTFAASLSRPFTISASPPHRKRPSPVDAVLSSLAPANVTWGGTTILGSVKETPPLEIPPDSDDEDYDLEDPSTEFNGVNLTMETQDVFDDEGCMSAPLLQLKQSARFSSYRKAYAELLFIWGQYLSRLEILKFSGLPNHFTMSEDGKEIKPFSNKTSYTASIASNDNASTIKTTAPSSPILLGRTYTQDNHKEGRREKRTSGAYEDRGVDITGYCLKHDCGNRLLPLSRQVKPKLGHPETKWGAVGHCDRCNLTQKQLRCVICLEPISALYTPCLSCGCASHQSCLLMMHAAGELKCAGGCDCECVEQAGSGMVESVNVMMGLLIRTGNSNDDTDGLENLQSRDRAASSGDESPIGGGERNDHFDERQRDREWGVDNKSEWDDIPTAINLVQGQSGGTRSGFGGVRTHSPSYSGAAAAALLGSRLDRVRAGDWGGSLRKKASSLRNERSFDSH